MITGTLATDHVLLERTDPALVLWQKGYGTLLKRGVKLSLLEACYLEEKEKIAVKNPRNLTLSHAQIVKAAIKLDTDFLVKYAVFADLRTRGYLVKTALKFGAEFRVYDKGSKPGVAHAKWVVYPVREAQKMTWYELSAKNRVAHSTNKRLLLAIVDEEEDVTYFEVSWIRP